MSIIQIKVEHLDEQLHILFIYLYLRHTNKRIIIVDPLLEDGSDQIIMTRRNHQLVGWFFNA